MVAFPVWSLDNDFWKKKKKTGYPHGGHCVSFVGYNETAFIYRNSWGDEYGDKGYWYYPYSDWGSHWEIWTSIDDESEVLDNLRYKNDPDPDEKKKNNKNDQENKKRNDSYKKKSCFTCVVC